MKGDTRCVSGRLMRHDPQFDDPELETDIGECPECEGKGRNCADCAASHAEETWEDYAPYRSGFRQTEQHFCTSCADHRRDQWMETHAMTHTPPQPDEAGATCKDSLHVGTPQPQSGVREEDVERAAKAIYEIEPFYMPTGEARAGIQIARKFDYSDAPASTQIRAQQLARAALQSISGAEGWQPIETAPKDGRAVLLYQPWVSGRETTCIGHYANGWVNQLCLYCAHDQEREFGGEIGNEVSHCDPTHWQPLPPPPVTQEQGG